MGEDRGAIRRRFPALLLGALALGLAVRLPLLASPLQVDEFNTLLEIAYRRTATEERIPGARDPLLPVASFAEVRSRTVLPYGIRPPAPIYPLSLHALLRGLPLAEWSLRLPSLVAGLATNALLALLAWRLAGPTAGTVAAFLAALDPQLVVSSVTARPYAAAGFTIALSFLLHPAVLRPRRGAALCAAAAGHGLALAATAYLNPVLALVGAAHVTVTVLPRGPAGGDGRRLRLRPAAAWAAGVVFALLLTLPLLGYLEQLGQLTHRWRACLASPYEPLGARQRLEFLLWQNFAVLLALLAFALASAAAWRQRRRASSEPPAPFTAGRSPAPQSQPRALVSLGAAWLLAPQVAAALILHATGDDLVVGRYLFYTSQGGVLLAAGLVASGSTATLRRDAAILTTLALLMLLGSQGLRGECRWTDRFPVATVRALSALDDKGLWDPGDMLLFHSVLVEGDLLPDGVPEQTRALVRQALLAPLSTLYVGGEPRDALPLTKTLVCEGQPVACSADRRRLQERFYGEALAAKLGTHRRYWFLGLSLNSGDLLACLVPTLTERLGATLTVTLRGLDRPEKILQTLRVSRGSSSTRALPLGGGSAGPVLALIEPDRR